MYVLSISSVSEVLMVYPCFILSFELLIPQCVLPDYALFFVYFFNNLLSGRKRGKKVIDTSEGSVSYHKKCLLFSECLFVPRIYYIYLLFIYINILFLLWSRLQLHCNFVRFLESLDAQIFIPFCIFMSSNRFGLEERNLYFARGLAFSIPPSENGFATSFYRSPTFFHILIYFIILISSSLHGAPFIYNYIPPLFYISIISTKI